MPKANNTPHSVFIYSLSDPRTGTIYYVGQTIDPEFRSRSHIYQTRTGAMTSKRDQWVASLLRAGVEPRLDVIAEVEHTIGNDTEQKWINRLYCLGCPLVNQEVIRIEKFKARRLRARR